MFKSIYEEQEKFIPCSCGDQYRILYEKDVDDNGLPTIKEVGKEDTRKIIQSYADSCSVTRIIERASAGDITALNSKEVIWTDSDVDLQFMKGKTSQELYQIQNSTILNLYNGNKAYQSISLEDFSKLVIDGNFKAISELKEVANNE